jgi:quercetin dioxygenase-like cupin family protein
MTITLDKEETLVSNDRKIYNPVQKDYATFLKTSRETNGEYTLIEIEVAPGGKTTPHYHKTYAEHFEVLQGTLEVMADGETRTLRPGEEAVAPINTLHNFHNPTSEPTTFLVELRPGSEGFEKALKAGYGLARDGLVRADGTPRSFSQLAVLLEWSEIRIPGLFTVIEPLFRILVRRAKRKGVDRELEERYC